MKVEFIIDGYRITLPMDEFCHKWNHDIVFRELVLTVKPKSCAGELVFEITQDEKYIDIKLF